MDDDNIWCLGAKKLSTIMFGGGICKNMRGVEDFHQDKIKIKKISF